MTTATKFAELEQKFFEFSTGQELCPGVDLVDNLNEIQFESILTADENGFQLRFTDNENSVEVVAVGKTFEEVCGDMLSQLV